jgi:FkbM family methyltransferase
MTVFHRIKKSIKRAKPFLWLSVIVQYEKNKKREIQKHSEWLKSNDYIQHTRCQPWFRVNGDETLRLEYDLDDKSIVFDVGGYKGEFATAIISRYNSNVYIFEPLPQFYAHIKKVFIKNHKVHTYCFGLSNKSSFEYISLADNSSSIYIKNAETEKIELKDIIEFMREEQIEYVDLLKLNIEGAEYDLLDWLISNNWLTKFKNIQVQFHDFVIPNAEQRMRGIQDQLKKTHELTYQYEFVWENWKLKI